MDISFSAGKAVTADVRHAIRSLPERLWHPLSTRSAPCTGRRTDENPRPSGRGASQRLLNVAARLTHGDRRLRLRISKTWSWRNELATAFHRLAALPSARSPDPRLQARLVPRPRANEGDVWAPVRATHTLYCPQPCFTSLCATPSSSRATGTPSACLAELLRHHGGRSVGMDSVARP
jgi:hypothetical protein